MCGISGIIYKLDFSKDIFPVGSDLVKMLESMTHRGRDFSGVTVSGVRLVRLQI
jgi:asparagine synthetase B (glutamine-hydrolysing)